MRFVFIFISSLSLLRKVYTSKESFMHGLTKLKIRYTISKELKKIQKERMKKMQIQYLDKMMEVNEGEDVQTILKEELKQIENVIACRINNEVRDLHATLKPNDKVELITTKQKEGNRVYIRGLLYIMGKAFRELYPEAKLTVMYQISNAMFCDAVDLEITEEVILNVRRKMQEIVDRDLPIIERIMSKEEAEAFYEKEKTLFGRLQLDNPHNTNIRLYFCEEYYNYFYGVMPVSTGYIQLYDITPYKGGFLVRYPKSSNPNVVPKYEETKKLFASLKEYEDIHEILGVNTVYRLNKKVEEGKASETALLAEALHDKKIAQLADKIAKNKQVKVILIAGPSSSGKTTFAKKLGIQLRLNGIKPVTLSVDNYFVERADNPVDADGNLDFECLEAIDLSLLNKDLTALLEGKEIRVPTFDFKEGVKKYKGNTLKLAEDEVLVMEGIHCLNDALTPSIPRENKFKIYISALTVLNIDYYNRISTTDTRLVRRLVRDSKFRGYTALQTLQKWTSVNRGENMYIYPYQEQADAMMNTSLIYELAVLKKYAIPLLREIDKTHQEYADAQRMIALLEYFKDIPDECVPSDSLLREFIGKGVFEYD